MSKDTCSSQTNERNGRYLYASLIFGLLLIFFPEEAWADTGLPMLAVTMPVMLIGLIPIICIEAFVIKTRLSLTTKKAFVSSATANAVSTLAGVPLTWGALLAIQMVTGGDNAYGTETFIQKFLAVTWQAPWLIPYEDELRWMVPVAMLVLLIPFFFVSWGIEYLVVRKINRLIKSKVINAACLRANLITYGLLILFPVGLYFLQ